MKHQKITRKILFIVFSLGFTACNNVFDTSSVCPCVSNLSENQIGTGFAIDTVTDEHTLWMAAAVIADKKQPTNQAVFQVFAGYARKFAEKITQGVFNYGPDEGTFVLRTAIRNNDDSVISHLYDDLPSFLDESKYVFISTGTCRIISYSTTKQLDLNDATLK